MSEPGAPFVFVSYARTDSEFVYHEVERLERQGYRLWIDREAIPLGEVWRHEICEAIARCSCFLIFITRSAVESANVLDEVRQAASAGKPLLCVYWEKVDLPAALQELIGAIQRLEHYAVHTAAYETALERALSRRVRKVPVQEQRTAEPPLAVSPKAVYFTLVLLALFFLIFAITAVIPPFIPGPGPDDPLGNRVVGTAAGCVFLVIAAGLAIAGLFFRRRYLRRRDG